MSIQNFIPEVWTASIMEALYESHVFAQPAIVNRNYEGEIKSQGDTVHITGIEPVSIGDYKRYQDIVFEEIDLNTRTMFIDQAKYFALAIDDIDKWQQKGDTMGPAMKEAGYKMSLAVDLFVAKKMMDFVELSPSNIQTTAITGDTLARGQAVRSAFVKLRTQLKRNNVQAQGQWAIVSPEVYAILLEDPHFIEADKRGNASVVESANGVVGSIYGFSIMESNNAPTSASGTTHHILAGNNTAISFAEALTEVESVRFEKSFGDGIKGLHVYGAKGIRPEGLVRMDLTGLTNPATPVTFRDPAMVENELAPSRFGRDMTPSHTTPKQKIGDGEYDVNPVDDVSDKTPVSLKLTPANNTVAPAGTAQLVAKMTWSDGSVTTVTPTSQFESNNTAKATVNSTGLVTGVAVGTAVITAYEAGLSATANVKVA